jgi:hypothetical protein
MHKASDNIARTRIFIVRNFSALCNSKSTWKTHKIMSTSASKIQTVLLKIISSIISDMRIHTSLDNNNKQLVILSKHNLFLDDAPLEQMFVKMRFK